MYIYVHRVYMCQYLWIKVWSQMKKEENVWNVFLIVNINEHKTSCTNCKGNRQALVRPEDRTYHPWHFSQNWLFMNLQQNRIFLLHWKPKERVNKKKKLFNENVLATSKNKYEKSNWCSVISVISNASWTQLLHNINLQ